MRFLEFVLEIGGETEVVIERSGEFGVRGAQFLAARKDQVHFGYDERQLADAMSTRSQVDDLVMDRLGHSVQRSGHTIDLSPKEFALLEFLMRNAGHPVSRSTIVEQVWRLNEDTMSNLVDVYINYLRRKVDSGYDRPPIRPLIRNGARHRLPNRQQRIPFKKRGSVKQKRPGGPGRSCLRWKRQVNEASVCRRASSAMNRPSLRSPNANQPPA